MNKKILGLALPNIITNVTVPLLGMVDMAIVGHLSAAHIGAIAIGSQLFNLIYWNFGFLRMGTSGFTAQAYGAGNMGESVRTFVRAIAIAAAVALMLLILQWPLSKLALLIFEGSPNVLHMALIYFFVRIWAAPATLSLYAIKGWFIGMQNSKLPMRIAIFLNVVNICCSLLFVLVLHWDIAGVALGTVIAQYSGMLMGIICLKKYYGDLFANEFKNKKETLVRQIKSILRWEEMKGFFRVNGDIFIRTVCLAVVFTFVTSTSGHISDEILAIDALLMQFITLFSYIMDGFAYAGESLVGRFIGASDRELLRKSVRMLMLWGMVMTIVFTLFYALGNEWILGLFSNDPSVLEGAKPFVFWTLVIPICSFAAFLFDGIYVGATASRAMRNSMFVASSLFFAIYYGTKALLSIDGTDEVLWNNVLMASFMAYLSLRGLILALLLKKSIYNKIPLQLNN